jgi:hypothetical protein
MEPRIVIIASGDASGGSIGDLRKDKGAYGFSAVLRSRIFDNCLFVGKVEISELNLF